MATPDETYTVEETELTEFEMGFITGALSAWGIKGEPTETQYRDALALLMAQANEPGS
jgi:hypothetical protein